MKSAWVHCVALLGPLLSVGLIAAPSASAAPTSRLLRPSIDSWIAADLDGDRKADLATSGAVHREGSGFVQEVTVHLGAVETRISVRTETLAKRLTARDLDGDADRDLVLESFDREPLAILLNDGGGRFHLADLDDFRGRLPHREPHSLEAPSPDSDSPDMSEDAGNPAPELSASAFQLHLTTAPLALESPGIWPILDHSSRSTRGPPRS